MKTGNKIYSGRLMNEAMRQIKLPGIIGTVLFAGIAFFSAIVKLFELRENGGVLGSYSFMDMNMYIMLVMYIFAPLMVMLLFGFMNKRRASDFYHSLPYSRACIYISFLSAVIVWCIIIIAAGSLVTAVISLASDSLQLDYKSMLLSIIGAISGCVLTMAATVLAMTLTGTYLTNVITAILILFVPRGIMFACNRMFSAATPFVVLSENVLAGNESNIPFSLIVCILGYYGIDEMKMFSSPLPSLYSAVLGLIYIFIGAACFVRRKSENATQATINRGLQAVLRMIPAIVISLVAVSVLFETHTSGGQLGDSRKFVVVMSYVAAVVVYFLYEIITTRRIRKIYRTIPGLLAVFAVSLVLYFSLRFSYDRNIARTPDAGEIEYVVVHGPENDVFWQDTDDVKLYSEASRTVTSDCLKDTISLWMNNRTGAKGFYSQFYAGNMVVEYHYADGRSMTRKVIVNTTRYSQLQRALSGESDFAENFGRRVFESGDIQYYVGNLDSNTGEAREVYNTFINELKTKGISELFNIIDDRSGNNSLCQIGFFDVGGMYSTAYIGLDMPRTLVEYMNALNAQYRGEACESFIKLVSEVKENAGNDEYGDGTYLTGSLDLNLYTVLPDGTFEVCSAHEYAYDDENYTTVSSDECMEYISELGGMLKARKVSQADIKPGAMLLYMQYYEDRQIPKIHYDGTEYSVLYTSNIMQSDSDYGWYIVDERAAELIKKISMETTVEIEK